MALTGEAKREWRRKNAEKIRAYMRDWKEKKRLAELEYAHRKYEQMRLIDPALAERVYHSERMRLDPAYREAWHAERRRGKRAARYRLTEEERAHRARLKSDPAYAAWWREEQQKRHYERFCRRLASNPEYAARVRERKRARKKTPEERERDRRKSRERLASDPEYAARVRERDRERYARNAELRGKKIRRQALRRVERNVMRLGELFSTPGTKKPCGRCGQPVVGRRLGAIYCCKSCCVAAQIEHRRDVVRKAREATVLADAARRALIAEMRAKRVRCCEYCGNPIEQSLRGGPRKKFCSSNCRAKSHYHTNPIRSDPRGHSAGGRKRFRKLAFCPTCRGRVLRSHLSGERPKYCSLRCGFFHFKCKRESQRCRHP